MSLFRMLLLKSTSYIMFGYVTITTFVSRNQLWCVYISSLTLSNSDCSVCSCALYYCDLFHIQLSC